MNTARFLFEVLLIRDGQLSLPSFFAFSRDELNDIVNFFGCCFRIARIVFCFANFCYFFVFVFVPRVRITQ